VNPAWAPDQGTCEAELAWEGGSGANPEHRRIAGMIPHSGYLVLDLLTYPAWAVRLNGQRLTGLPSRSDGLFAVPVSAGPVNLVLDWTTAPGDVAGRWLSALSAFLLLALSLSQLRWRPSRLT